MITVYNVMLVTLGTLLAALGVLFLLPAYRRRIERFTTERIKRALPLTETEIRADKDRIRAEYATEVHKLEMKLEDSNLAAARQSVEINRREAKIHELERAVEAQKSSVEEHQNARRVLEQTILDRLPRVESRLGDARRMLLQRDGEIAALSETSTRQTEALEQATQINVQLTEEVHRLRAALDTRAARNREAIGDPRFDGEVALRTEIEALRAKTRDQQQMIDRLQGATADGADESDVADAGVPTETERLRAELAKAEAQIMTLKSSAPPSERLHALEAAGRDQLAEIARLKAALKAYDDGLNARAGEDDALAAKAEINALQAEVEEQRRTIEALRADVSGSNERLARQAQHFRDEMRRLSSQKFARETEDQRNAAEAPRRSLAERIAQPRVPRAEASVEVVHAPAGESGREARPAAFLKAVNGGAEIAPAQSGDAAGHADVNSGAQVETASTPRRARLLERISNIEKT